jgi:hypothetical protein
MTDLELLCLYQGWSNDIVCRYDRAIGIVAELRALSEMPKKSMAIDWLIRAGWTDTKVGAKRLVDPIWTSRHK